MTEPLPIDWVRVLEDIAFALGEPVPDGRQRVPAGASTTAQYLGVSRGALRGWLDGAEPRHSDGELITLAWCRLTGKGQPFVPRTRRALSASQVR